MIQKFLAFAGLTAALLVCAAACSEDSRSRAANQRHSAYGGLGVALTFPNGLKVDTVQYEVLDAATDELVTSATLDVSTRASVLIAVQLRPGSYVIHVTTNGPTLCDGTSRPFQILPGADQLVPLTIVCGTPINLNTEVITFLNSSDPSACGIRRLTLTPSSAGTDFALAVTAGSGKSFSWTASDTSLGAFSNSAAANTVFACSKAGATTVSVTLTDALDPTCNVTQVADVVCAGATQCGNGVVDPGEDCDGGGLCSPICSFAGCGNGVVEAVCTP